MANIGEPVRKITVVPQEEVVAPPKHVPAAPPVVEPEKVPA